MFIISVLVFYAQRGVRTWRFFLGYYRERMEVNEKKSFEK
jgi:hypothetical protein